MNSFSTARILLIEDEQADAFLVEQYLSDKKNHQYEIQWVSDFDQAVEIVTTGQVFNYDVILVDYFLGKKNGLDFMKILDEKKINLPVILITGVDNYNVDLEAMKLGASDFIIKGQFDADILDRSIRYAIELKKNQKLIIQQQQKEALLYKATALADMAQFVAHEINNPLASIQGNAAAIQILLKKEQPDVKKAQDLVERIFKMIDRIGEIKKNLKTYFTHLAEEQLVQGDLNVIIRESLQLCRDKMSNRQVEVKFDNQQPHFVGCHPVELSQVFTNLINNSYEALVGVDNPWIQIEIKNNGPSVQVLFTDNGPGISEETRAKMFTKFYTTKEKGTGVGLYLSKSIIENYGGQFYLNQESKNTQFIVELPAVGSEAKKNIYRLLVVDDQTDFADIVAENISYLEIDDQIKVDVETSPLRAMQLVQQNHYDAIIIDLHMHEMNGIDFALSMINSTQNPPIFSFMSGYFNKTAIETIHDKHLGLIFEKPLDVSKMISETLAHIKSKSA